MRSFGTIFGTEILSFLDEKAANIFWRKVNQRSELGYCNQYELKEVEGLNKDILTQVVFVSYYFNLCKHKTFLNWSTIGACGEIYSLYRREHRVDIREFDRSFSKKLDVIHFTIVGSKTIAKSKMRSQVLDV